MNNLKLIPEDHILLMGFMPDNWVESLVTEADSLHNIVNKIEG